MPTTALLVIDIQRGAFDGVRCPPIDGPEVLVERAASLVGAARAGQRPIVFIQHCAGPGDVLEEGSVHWELHGRLAAQPGDAVVRKHASSAFEGTNLAEVLAGFDAKEVVVCGLQSELCVYNTANAALALGYAVVVAQDAHSTWPSASKAAAAISEDVNARLQAGGAALRSTEALANTLREART